MAGEWIRVDCCLERKPEFVRIQVLTGSPADEVLARLVRFWLWVQLEACDGAAKGDAATLGILCGGDADWWLAVESAGWVQFQEGETIVIPRWEEVFSATAKQRCQTNLRQSRRRGRDSTVTPALRERDTSVTGALRERDSSVTQALQVRDESVTAALPEEKRREEKKLPAAQVATSETRSRSGSTPKDPIFWDLEDGWQGISPNDRQEWADAYPAANLDQELAKATAWLKANPTKARRKNWRKFLVNWLSRCQDGGGSARGNGARPAEKPPPERWLDKYKPSEYRRPKELIALSGPRSVEDE